MIGNNVRSMLRVVLLPASLATYLVSPDDIVWRFIKLSPHARLLEHLAFGAAAALLGVALLLKLQAGSRGGASVTPAIFANLLQAVGIGSLLPLPGFLLLVLGDLAISLLFRTQQPKIEDDSQPSNTATSTAALTGHIGLTCAFASMVVFSIVLVDRVADILFAASALVSLAVTLRNALQVRPSRSG